MDPVILSSGCLLNPVNFKFLQSFCSSGDMTLQLALTAAQSKQSHRSFICFWTLCPIDYPTSILEWSQNFFLAFNEGNDEIKFFYPLSVYPWASYLTLRVCFLICKMEPIIRPTSTSIPWNDLRLFLGWDKTITGAYHVLW